MKEIRETKMVEQTTVKFIADDGKEFTDKVECDCYERNKKRELLEAKLKPIMTEIEVPVLNWFGKYAYKVKARNTDDVINLYARYNEGSYYFKEFEDFFEIDKTVYLIIDDYYPCLYNHDLEEEMKNFGKKKTEKKTDK